MPRKEPEDESNLAGDGWIRVPRADWRDDAAYSLKTPAFLRPVKTARLDAISTLHQEAAATIQNALPQTKQQLELCLWPAFSKYGEDLFDKMAGARLSRRGGRSKSYGRWLRSKCLPAVVDDICRPIFGQFPITVRHVVEVFGEKQSQEIELTRRALWGMLTEVIGGPFTDNLRKCLSAQLEGRTPHWEASAVQTQRATSADDGSRVEVVDTKPSDPTNRTLAQTAGAAGAGGDSNIGKPNPEVVDTKSSARGQTPPRRTPDLQSSLERLNLVAALARELATIKLELNGFTTAEDLKRKHPEFVLWGHIDDSELKELVAGSAFTPKAYAENLTLRNFGITSKETLKKDRAKIRKAQKAGLI